MFTVVTSPDQLRALIGEDLGPSAPLAVDQARIDAFAEATGDDQWLHTDPERARSGPFGATIAHGYLTLSLIPLFSRSLFSIEFGSARVNYGVDKVRFPAPVRVGTQLSANAVFTDVSESRGGLLVRARYTVAPAATDAAVTPDTPGASARSARPACVAETLILVRG